MRTALVIPSLGRVAPQMLASYGGAAAAQIALALFDRGIVTERLATSRRTSTQMVEEALGVWWRDELGTLRTLPRLSLHVVHEVNRQGIYGQDLGAGLWIHLGVIEGNDGIPRLALAPRCEELQREVPGLGAYAIHALDQAQRHCAQVVNPMMALGLASYVYWHGELDEQAAVDEYVAMGEYPEILTRAQFMESIPEWAAARKSWRMGSAPATPFTASARAREVLGACAEIKAASAERALKVLGHMDRQSDERAECLAFAAIARWKESDVMGQILDDWYQDAAQSEYWDTSASYVLDDGKDLKAWLRAMPSWLRVYRAMDRLLTLVGVPIE